MNQYTIQFSGLKDGKHDFTFEIGKELFAFYENPAILLLVFLSQRRVSNMNL